MTRFTLYVCMILILPACGYSQYNNIYPEAAWDERDEWQQPEKIIEATGITKGSTVADLGCHEGYMTIKLAEEVGQKGKVYAVDVNTYRLERLAEHLSERKLENVEVVKGEYDDPKLPENMLDAVLILDAYHEMDDYKQILKHIKKALRGDGKLVIVEPVGEEREGWTRSELEGKHEIAIHFVIKDLEHAGYRILQEDEMFIDRSNEKGDHLWLLVAEVSN